ncbi:MAG: DUF6503 family protein [Bacteroidota bacterium]
MKSLATTLLLTISLSFSCFSQNLTSEEILNKAIAYHDPNGEWNSFAYRLFFDQDLPDGSISKEIVELNNATSYFKAKRQKNEVEFGLNKDSCFVISTKKLPCERITMMRNYYLYLWGLPMKLKDPGTNLDAKVREGKFGNTDCYILRVPYEKDIWYFYFDKASFAMKGYEFFKDEAKRIGERIELTGEFSVGNMKLPQNRKWNNTHDQQYLATDKLVKAEKLD